MSEENPTSRQVEHEPPGAKLRFFQDRATARIPKADRGKCLTCGFVAEASGDADIEVRDIVRRVGTHPAGGRPVVAFCFVSAFDLVGEVGEILNKDNVAPTGRDERRREAMVNVIAKDRQCSAWYPYTPGASPLWHREEWRMLSVERTRDEREREIAQIHERIQNDSKDIAQKLHDVTAATSRFTTKWTYVAVTVAGLALLLGAANYFYPD